MSQESLKGAVREVLDGYFENIHTALPAEVLFTDGAKANVQPVLNKEYLDGSISPYPIINNVPIRFMQTKLTGLSLDITVGDSGLVVFSERDFSAYKKLGTRGEAPTRRKFDYSNCFFIPVVVSEVIPQTHYRPLSTTLFRNDAGIIDMVNAILSHGALMQDFTQLMLELTVIGSSPPYVPSPVWLAKMLALQIQFAILHGTGA